MGRSGVGGGRWLVVGGWWGKVGKQVRGLIVIRATLSVSSYSTYGAVRLSFLGDSSAEQDKSAVGTGIVVYDMCWLVWSLST